MLSPCITLRNILVLTLLVSPVFAYAGESATSTALAQKIRVAVVEPVLISHKICADTNDCDQRAVIRFSVAGQISWRIYGLSDSVVVNELFSKLLLLARKLPKNNKYAIYAYREPESEVGLFSKPIAQLIIQGEL